MKPFVNRLATGAAFNRGGNDGVYRTPDNFRGAVVARFGEPYVDLACNAENQFGPRGITQGQDSLSLVWKNQIPTDGYGWLNPPYNNIKPWVEKCHGTTARVMLLVPASIGSNWFRDFVYRSAHVLALNGRMSFDGKWMYPKDLIVGLYNFPGMREGEMTIWDWKQLKLFEG